MEKPLREGATPGPSWVLSESTAFRLYSTVVGEWAEASPSAPGNGVSARSSNLRAVRKRPVRFLHLPLSCGYPEMLASCCCFTNLPC
jgi:hypothetical protein